MFERLATRAKFGNAEYPTLVINWSKDDMGYEGVGTVWTDRNTALEEKHDIGIRVSSPVGLIVVNIDCHPSGHVWASASFEGDNLTIRDLQWVTLWAVQVIERMQTKQ